MFAASFAARAAASGDGRVAGAAACATGTATIKRASSGKNLINTSSGERAGNAGGVPSSWT